MTNILHIPTGNVFTSIPTYIHLKWFFNIKQDDFYDFFDLSNTETANRVMKKFITECDEIEFLDTEKKTPMSKLSNKSAIQYLQDNYNILEFEVLD